MNEKQMGQIAKRVLEGMYINNSTGRWCLGVLMEAGVVQWDSEEEKYVECLDVQIEENMFGWHADVFIGNKEVGSVHYRTDGSVSLTTNDNLSRAEDRAILAKCEQYYGKEFKEKKYD